MNTQGDHFDPNPASWLLADAETTITPHDSGVDTKTINLTSASAHVAGIQQIDWNLRDGGDLKTNVRTRRLGALGAQVRVLDLTSGADTTVWSVLADAPDSLAVSVDAESEANDDDPLSVTWDTGGGRIGAAVAVDATYPENDDREVVASAWIGTGNGRVDGLAANATAEFDLEGDDKLLSLTSPVLGQSRTAVDAGFATRTGAQSDAGFATQGHVTMRVPDDVHVAWSVDGHTLEEATLSTCANLATTCAVEDLAATIVNVERTGDLVHDALEGVAMVPVPDADGAEFPDFTAYPEAGSYAADWAHVVWHDDPLAESEWQERPVLDARDIWGLDLHIDRVSDAEFRRDDDGNRVRRHLQPHRRVPRRRDGGQRARAGLLRRRRSGRARILVRRGSHAIECATARHVRPQHSGPGRRGRDRRPVPVAAGGVDERAEQHDLLDIYAAGCAVGADGAPPTLTGGSCGDEASVAPCSTSGRRAALPAPRGIPVPRRPESTPRSTRRTSGSPTLRAWTTRYASTSPATCSCASRSSGVAAWATVRVAVLAVRRLRRDGTQRREVRDRFHLAGLPPR